MILLGGILSPGQLRILALMLAIDLNFLLVSFKFNQSHDKNLKKKKKKNINLSSIERETPKIMGWIYMVNIGLSLEGLMSSETPILWPPDAKS